MGWGAGMSYSFLAYNGSSQKEVAPNVGHNYLEIHWTTEYEYWINWINSNLDDPYKICNKTFFIGSCMSVCLCNTHTHKYLFVNLMWCGHEERTFKGKRSSGDSGTCKDNFVGYSSTTITVYCHELVCMWLCHFMIIKVWCRACKNIFYFFNSLVFF